MAVAAPALALTDEEIVKGLEAIGDFESAYAMASQIAQKTDSYEDWKRVAVKYARYDGSNRDRTYDKAWQAVRRINAEGAYRDFMTIRPNAPANSMAVHAIYQLKREVDTIGSYRDFIKSFPNAPEAAQSMMRIHEIAFGRAREKDTAPLFDAFVAAFPGAKQRTEAMQLAEQADRREVDTELGGLMSSFFSDEKRERVARRLYNDARVAEDAKQDWVAARKYKLLEEPRFRDTKVFTEVKDRGERLRHQQVMERYQQALTTQIKGLQTALVSEIRSSKTEIVAAIGEHNRRIEAAMNAQASAYRDYVDSQVGAISSAISYQREAMESAMRQASAQNEYLFNRAQEQAREQAVQNRECAEQLTKHGKFPWYSSCT